MASITALHPMHEHGAKLAIIAICTYKRPKMLLKCLMSLLAQEAPPNVILHIVVVDNDARESGKQSYIRFSNLCPFGSHYIVRAKRGIAAARNAAREYAIGADADYLLFIDDDEEAGPQWANGLLHEEYLDTPILYGWPVFDYPESVPEWARPKSSKAPKEGEARFVGTGNMRISKAAFKHVAFNEDIGLSGGEDQEFHTRAELLGFDAKFTRRAITFEHAHVERYTIASILSRTHWVAAANMRANFIKHGRTSTIAKKLPSIAFCGPIALVTLAFGATQFAFQSAFGMTATGSRRRMLRAAKIVARSLGYWDAINSRIPQSYARTVGE